MSETNEASPATNGSDLERHVRCECHACIKEHDLRADCFGGALPLSASKMVLCPECGNKRCPKASNHRNTCTGSNEPGQAGSVYT